MATTQSSPRVHRRKRDASVKRVGAQKDKAQKSKAARKKSPNYAKAYGMSAYDKPLRYPPKRRMAFGIRVKKELEAIAADPRFMALAARETRSFIEKLIKDRPTRASVEMVGKALLSTCENALKRQLWPSEIARLARIFDHINLTLSALALSREAELARCNVRSRAG